MVKLDFKPKDIFNHFEGAMSFAEALQVFDYAKYLNSHDKRSMTMQEAIDDYYMAKHESLASISEEPSDESREDW